RLALGVDEPVRRREDADARARELLPHADRVRPVPGEAAQVLDDERVEGPWLLLRPREEAAEPVAALHRRPRDGLVALLGDDLPLGEAAGDLRPKALQLVGGRGGVLEVAAEAG